MKKQIFLLGAAAALFTLGSCSSAEDGPKNPSGTGEAVTSFMAVNIVQPNEGTRAEGSQTPGDPAAPADGTGDNAQATYEEGFANENAVKKIRFYFFDNSDNAVNVHYVKGSDGADGSFQSYVDIDRFSDAGTQMPNVEKVLSATIIINTEDRDAAKPTDNRPTKVVAVLNPGTFLDDESFSSVDGSTTFNAKAPTLAELKTVIKNHAEDAKTSTSSDGTFMMTNSVYVDGVAEKFAVSTEGHFYNENGPALNNPVDIYVERAVAKARVDISATKATDSDITDADKANYTYIKLMDVKDSSTALTFNGEQLFLKLSKWDVTCTPNIGYLAKHVETTWTTETLWNGWTYPTFFRSFWAKNPTFDEVANKSTEGYKGLTWNATWNEVQNNGVSYGFKNGGAIDNTNIRYMNENAPQAIYDKNTNYNQFTKILLCGQVVKADGTPVTIASYAGNNMTKSELAAAVIQNLQNNGDYYYKKNSDGNGYVSIDENDIEFKTASDVNKADDKEYGEKGVRCYVYAQLKDNTYYTSSVKDATSIADSQASEVEDLSKLNTKLVSDFGRAKIWNDGMTYYYITLQHLNTTNKVGGYGVVRNHIYECDINSIAGLGTPVYDKDEVIYPEKPAEDEWKLAARIKILSWRVVKNSYTVGW